MSSRFSIGILVGEPLRVGLAADTSVELVALLARCGLAGEPARVGDAFAPASGAAAIEVRPFAPASGAAAIEVRPFAPGVPFERTSAGFVGDAARIGDWFARGCRADGVAAIFAVGVPCARASAVLVGEASRSGELADVRRVEFGGVVVGGSIGRGCFFGDPST
jgi:hypothetical protein